MTGYSSGHLAEQARIDLGLAQHIALANASGEALGTAMFLAQQCIEKQFKSIFLRIAEALAIGLDADFCKKTLGHVVHLHPEEFYARCLKAIGHPDGGKLDPTAAVRLGQLAHMGKIWDRELYGSDTRDLLFLYYLEVPLPEDKLRLLDSYLAGVFEKINLCDGSDATPPMRHFSQRSTESMPDIISDPQRLRQRRVSHANHPINIHTRFAAERLFCERLASINQAIDANRLFPKPSTRDYIKFQLLDYGSIAIMLHSPAYSHLQPHSRIGRYPTELHGGRLSTDVYASQRNAVLGRLFLNVQYDYDQLCAVNDRLDDLRAIFQRGGL